MMILRYFWWLQVYHFTTFFRQMPWSFLIGALLAPYFLVSRLMYPPEIHEEVVANGISTLKSYWQMPGAIPPPKFVEKRFLALERDVTHSRREQGQGPGSPKMELHESQT